MAMIEDLEEIIRETKGDNNIRIAPKTILLTDLKLDSFDIAQLVSEVERKFKIKVGDRDIAGFKTVSDIIDYIKARKK